MLLEQPQAILNIYCFLSLFDEDSGPSFELEWLDVDVLLLPYSWSVIGVLCAHPLLAVSIISVVASIIFTLLMLLLQVTASGVVSSGAFNSSTSHSISRSGTTSFSTLSLNSFDFVDTR